MANGQGLGIFESILGFIGEVAPSAAGVGTAAINGKTAQNVANTQAQYAGNASGGVSNIPGVVYVPTGAPAPAPTPAKSNKVWYIVGGVLVFVVIVGGIVWAVKTFGKTT